MNWLLIGIAAVIVLCALIGYWKGFLHILFSLVSIVLLVAFVTITTPYIQGFLEEHTTLQESMETRCLETLRSATEKNIENKVQDKNTDNRKMLEEAGIQLPNKVWESLLDAGIDAADQAIEESGIYQELAKIMSHYIVNGVASFTALIVGVILLFIVARLLNIVSKLPVIKEVNHFLGVVSGLVLGLVVTWIFFYIVAICCTSSFGIMMTDYIHRSAILTLLYNNNIILYLITMYL